MTESGYQALFNSYIVAGVEASLATVREAALELADHDRRQAWHTLSFALTVEEAWPSAGELLLALAPRMARAGHWNDWIPYLEQGVAQSKRLGDLGIEAELLLHLGHLRHRLSQFEQADRHVAEAVERFARLESPLRQAAALNRRAEIARGRRDFAAVERLTALAHDLLTTGPGVDTEEQGHTFLIEGRAAFDQQQWIVAGRHFERALALYEKTENRRRIAVCIQNLGRVRNMEQRYDDATLYYRRAIRLLERTNDVFNLAVVHMNLGIVHSLCNRPQAALTEYAAAEAVFRRLQERANLARVFNNQGMEMNNLGRWDEAEQLLQASSDLWLALDNLQEYVNAQDSLGLTYMGRNEYDRAIDIFEQALACCRQHPEQRFLRSTQADLAEHLAQARDAIGACLHAEDTLQSCS